ncbi:hypothetical protein GH714_011901 [Hevea brasiliensis]|uniref:Uncharacterized protein n=1 Tax=Hevea brasiliensis TaxID=3981 RepID=A0A6A6KZK1_HEVBR|nr:hypothetical protein GH714_011901 [Hevea brasiliensis]
MPQVEDFHCWSVKHAKVRRCTDRLALGSKRHWEGNLNATIEQLYMKCVGFEGIDDVQLSNFPMLKEKWHGQFPFKNLKRLRKCDSVEELFDLEGLNADEGCDPKFEELRVEYNTMKDMWSQADFLSGLKGIELTCFPMTLHFCHLISFKVYPIWRSLF